MPNRVIREGWIESERVDQLDADGERFYLRLCLKADDFGRYHGNHTLLKSNLFPLKTDVRVTDIPRWIAACVKAGLVRCYEVDGKRFLEIQRFDQRTRAQASKFPQPPADDGRSSELGGQTSDKCQADDGPPRTYSETETEAYSETETKGAPTGAGSGGHMTVIPLLLSTDEFKVAWGEYVQHRREKKKPITPTAEKLALKRLSELGVDRAIAAIRYSIAQGWIGIFEEDATGKPAKPIDPAFDKW